jgi:CNT family concentrative nucleoside transporter
VEQFQGIAGVVVILAFAWAISEDRRAIRTSQMLRLLGVGLALLVGLSLLFLYLDVGDSVFSALGLVVGALDQATTAGTSFVLGYLGGGSPPFEVKPGGSAVVLAFRFLPLILVISALSALLFHWRILPLVVNLFSWLLRRALGIRGALGVSAAANVFVGMVEAPLLVRP